MGRNFEKVNHCRLWQISARHTNTSIYSSQVLKIGLRSTLRQPKNLQLRWRQWETIIAFKRLAHFPFKSIFSIKFSTSTYPVKVAGVVFTVGGLASGAKGLMDVVKGATPGQVVQNNERNSQTFHFPDNYCWPWSRWRNIWREREQRDCQACRSGSRMKKSKFVSI